jgi:membrane protein DedA with SNARE-associated domain
MLRSLSMGFEHLVEQWGYLAILIGTLLEGETVVIAGGTMAHHGLLSLPLVIGVAYIGTTIGDIAWFFIGRQFGKPLLRRSEKWQARSERIANLIARFGVVFVLGFRFIYGIRTVTPAFLGATGYSPLKFMFLNFISAAIWAVAFGYIGYGIGAGLTGLLHRPGRIGEIVIAGILASVVVWLVTKEVGKRRRLKRESLNRSLKSDS